MTVCPTVSTGFAFSDAFRTDNIANVIGHFEFTVGSGSLGMNDSLGNALAIKVRQQVD